MTRMPILLIAFVLVGATALSHALPSPGQDCAAVNALTPAERAAGWQVLFDGKGITGWHGYNKQATVAWTVEDCALKTTGTEGNYGSDKRADLVTDREFTNFELTLDWSYTVYQRDACDQ